MNAPDYDFLEQEAPDDVVAEPTPEPVASVEPPATPAPAAPTAAEPLEGTHVPLAALKAERDKRQREESARKALEARLAELEKQQTPEPQFYEAPEQYVQHATNRAQQQMTQVLYAALEEAAREQYGDYDEVLGEVTAAAQDNPAIRQQVFTSPNPALAAYKLGKQLRQMKELQDPAAYRAKVEAEVRAQIKAEQDAAAAAKAAQVAAIPPDLSAARSARDEPVVEDDSLDSILASKKR